MRVTLLGPCFPYKGGIAHYMTLMARELRCRGHEVEFFGFRRQFPMLLYPGDGDLDPSERPLREPSQRTLDCLNPSSWARTGRLMAECRPDVTILSWWTSYWAPAYLTVFHQVKRLSRSRILLVCHNVVDHEPRWIKTQATQWVLRRADALLVHSAADAKLSRLIAPGVRTHEARHPDYRSLLTEMPSRDEARRKLGWNRPTLLFFGYVRKYKGLEWLIKSVPEIRRQVDAVLVVAGEFWEDQQRFEKLASGLGVAEHVRLVPGYVANEKAALYLAGADLLALPYVSATQSGIVQLAYAAGLPVVASRVGGFAEAVEDGVSGYLVEPRDPSAIARAVIDFFTQARADRFRQGVRDVRKRFSWNQVIEVVEQVGRASHVDGE